jgi:hypothetical protein
MPVPGRVLGIRRSGGFAGQGADVETADRGAMSADGDLGSVDRRGGGVWR